MTTSSQKLTDLDTYKYGFSVKTTYTHQPKKGLSEEVVRAISRMKGEPEWMTEFRLRALEIFYQKPMPLWGANLATIDFDDIYYYLKPDTGKNRSWDEVPPEIKETFDRLGIPEAERKFLAGVEAQFDSEVVYGSMKKHLSEKGVIFCDMDSGLREHPEIVKEYFGTLVPPEDNKFAALNSACWSGGSFVYVPKGVHVELPLQAYFRINAQNMGQFERTLIIADEGSSVAYVEGCTAPTYSTDSLHSAVVEIIAKPRSRVQYITVQNWSNNVYNLVTKRAYAYEDATVSWLDCNIGSKITMKYPSVYLVGPRARGEILSIAFAGKGQHQDAGGKMIHLAPDTSSTITSKSISKNGGRTSYRGLLKVYPGATNVKSRVVCDALILDPLSRSDTYPVMEIDEPDTSIAHEATVTKISQDQLFYLMSRGLTEQEAATMIVNGFLSPLVKEFPMEYAVELNRLMQLEMTGAVG